MRLDVIISPPDVLIIPFNQRIFTSQAVARNQEHSSKEYILGAHPGNQAVVVAKSERRCGSLKALLVGTT